MRNRIWRKCLSLARQRIRPTKTMLGRKVVLQVKRKRKNRVAVTEEGIVIEIRSGIDTMMTDDEIMVEIDTTTADEIGRKAGQVEMTIGTEAGDVIAMMTYLGIESEARRRRATVMIGKNVIAATGVIPLHCAIPSPYVGLLPTLEFE